MKMFRKLLVFVFVVGIVGTWAQTAETTTNVETTETTKAGTTETTKQDTTTQPETTKQDTTTVPETTKPDTTTAPETTKPDTTSPPETTKPDTTVTTPVTTEPPTTPNPSDAPTNNLTYWDPDTNRTCISVNAQFQFTINYPTKNGTKTSKIGVPTKHVLKGSCNVTSGEYIDVSFDEEVFDMKLTFKQTSVKGSGYDYAWDQVLFTYTLDEMYFPGVNASMKGKTMMTTFNMSADQFKAHSDSSYKCMETQTFTVDPVTLQVTDLQYYAYANTTDASFNGLSVSECSADSKTNSVVPIAVGAALAGLVVIVLIAYLIGRRRNRKGYESV